MPSRVYAPLTPVVEEALEHAPEALDLDDDASAARRSAAWIEYGYRRWREDKDREARILAYQELAEDRERLDIIRRSSREAVAAGLL